MRFIAEPYELRNQFFCTVSGSVTMMNIFGKRVPVEGIESLVTYESILGREVDTEDVRQLLAILKFKD